MGGGREGEKVNGMRGVGGGGMDGWMDRWMGGREGGGGIWRIDE